MIRVRPALVVATTPELFLVCLLYRIISSDKFILDLQEDYSKNITYQRIYRWPFSNLLQFGYFIFTRISGYVFEHYILAERIYSKEIEFVQKSFTVLENKTVDLGVRHSPQDGFSIVFTGTLSSYSGIQRVFEIFEHFMNQGCKASLVIAGYAPDPNIRKRISRWSSDKDEVTLIGLDYMVPHDEIVNLIGRAHLGIICHEISELNKDRVPTKMYEYAFYDLPFVIEEGTTWAETAHVLGKSIPIQFDNFNPQSVINSVHTLNDQEPNPHINRSSWSSVENEFISLISQLTTK